MRTPLLSRQEIDELIQFMQGPDNAVLTRLVSYFSQDSRYCHPRELKQFWESMNESEKDYYRALLVTREI